MTARFVKVSMAGPGCPITPAYITVVGSGDMVLAIAGYVRAAIGSHRVPHDLIVSGIDYVLGLLSKSGQYCMTLDLVMPGGTLLRVRIEPLTEESDPTPATVLNAALLYKRCGMKQAPAWYGSKV